MVVVFLTLIAEDVGRRLCTDVVTETDVCDLDHSEAVFVGDRPLRYAVMKFVVLLTDSDVMTAECVAVRLVDSVSTSSFVLTDGSALRVELASGYAIAPTDGLSLDDLVKIARDRALFGYTRPERRCVH